MNREPLSLAIFRLLVAFFILFLILMIYWSTSILEVETRKINQGLDKIRHEIEELQSKTLIAPQAANNEKHEVKKNGEVSFDKDNLLGVDPFYKIILPRLIGFKDSETKNFKPTTTLRMATLSKPINLHPFSQWSDVITWTNLCSVSVAANKFGYYESLAQDMALKMERVINEKAGLAEYRIELRDGVFFEPLKESFFTEGLKLAPHFLKKHPVTAHDFKFYFDAVMNPFVEADQAVTLRNFFQDLEEFKVIDDLTFTVRWKEESFFESDGKEIRREKYRAKFLTASLQPLARFVYQYFPDGKKIEQEDNGEDFYRTSKIWAQNFTEHFAKNIIVSSGAWIFEGLTDREIRFRKNPNFYNPFIALTENRVYEFKQSLETVWQDFKSGRFETHAMAPDQLVEFEKFLKSEQYLSQKEKGMGILRLDYLRKSDVHLEWNQINPLFRSKKVRRALTMAIDRKRIIAQNLNGMGIEITGPFFRYSKAYDESIAPLPFNPQMAKRLLEEEGFYDSDGDGIIDKEIDGKRVPFSFSLTYYVKSTLGKAIVEYVSTALKEVGIEVKLNGVDVTDLAQAFDDKNFDALFFIWALGDPPEDPEQLWLSSLAKVKGSSNSIGFQNSEVDEIIKELKFEYDEEKRIKLYHRFDQIIHEEQPYTFLFTPKVSLLYREYVKNVFIPRDRQDILPGSNAEEPDSSIFYIDNQYVNKQNKTDV